MSKPPKADISLREAKRPRVRKNGANGTAALFPSDGDCPVALPSEDNTPEGMQALLTANAYFRRHPWPAPYNQTLHRLHRGDARNLSWIPDASVHLVVTSPPYWTLKEYPRHAGQMGHIEDYDQFLDELDKVTDNAADPATSHQYACAFLPDLVEFVEELVVVLNVPHLPGVPRILLQSPIRRRGDHQVNRCVGNPGEVAGVASMEAMQGLVVRRGPRVPTEVGVGREKSLHSLRRVVFGGERNGAIAVAWEQRGCTVRAVLPNTRALGLPKRNVSFRWFAQSPKLIEYETPFFARRVSLLPHRLFCRAAINSSILISSVG